jgi:hypothetical protein
MKICLVSPETAALLDLPDVHPGGRLPLCGRAAYHILEGLNTGEGGSFPKSNTIQISAKFEIRI